MFTGIIEHLGTVERLVHRAGAAEVFVDIGPLIEGVKLGDSIAINGACLTVKSIKGTIVSFDISGESLEKTTFGKLRTSEKINVERSLRVGDRLGGHFISGHVDGTGVIEQKVLKTGSASGGTLGVSVKEELTQMMVKKGSVAVDGISLTIVDISPGWFSVALIPITLAATTLGFKKAGDAVNIETDMFGKWIKKFVSASPLSREKPTGITEEKLKELGF
ncbi:MAG TPA: riboflavin synthase [Candidatus Brocadiia bacterium]|nr:riboflavin synthase [Planctomycetota bacterium]MBI4008593.1 riboflavin synthase [Planctomycetota bacterium]MDO8092526.1 riboflavin synthase [Candidatus Brocadiales bacterium]